MRASSPTAVLVNRIQAALARGNNDYGKIEVEADDLAELLDLFAVMAADRSEIEVMYVGEAWNGEPDTESLRAWGSVEREQGKYVRRRPGPWIRMSARPRR